MFSSYSEWEHFEISFGKKFLLHNYLVIQLYHFVDNMYILEGF